MDRPRAVELLATNPLWDDFDGGVVVVACSGGRDSVALARATHEVMFGGGHGMFFVHDVFLELWHVDHGLRADSGQDAEFVEKLAKELGAECVIEKLDLAAELEKNGGNAEELARNERYRLLNQHLDADELYREHLQLVGFTAHHLGDQAETVLFNLIRGTHLGGLRGIAPVRDRWIHRPWLKLDPAEIDAYLKSLNQEYVDDPTNAETRLSRNKLRHEVMPLLQQINPQALQHIAGLADVARDAYELMEEQQDELEVEEFTEQAIDRWLPLIGWPNGSYDAYRIDEGWTNPVQTARFIADVLDTGRGSLNRADHDAIAQWLMASNLPGVVRNNTLALHHGRVITIAGPTRRPDPTPALGLELGTSASIGGLDVTMSRPARGEWQRRRDDGPEPWEQLRDWPTALDELTELPPDKPSWHCYLPSEVKTPLRIRAWQRGERIALPGGGSIKLGDAFTNAKIPKCFRQVWAVLVDAEDQPLWVPGVVDGELMQIPGGTEPAYLVSIRESG